MPANRLCVRVRAGIREPPVEELYQNMNLCLASDVCIGLSRVALELTINRQCYRGCSYARQVNLNTQNIHRVQV
jgi:hypothetical protein